MEQTVSFVLGVTSSLLATIIAVAVPVARRKFAIRHLRGVWVQICHADTRHPNSICFLQLRYAVLSQEYRIDGIVYNDKWRFDNRWSSMTCSIDNRQGRIFYSYSGHHIVSPFSTGHGYGMIEMRERGRKLGLHNGYFLNAFLDAATSTTPVAADYFHVSSVSGLEHIQALSDIEAALAEPNSALRTYVQTLLGARDKQYETGNA